MKHTRGQTKEPRGKIRSFFKEDDDVIFREKIPYYKEYPEI